MIPMLPAFATEKGGHFHTMIQLDGGLLHPMEPLFASKSAAGTLLRAQMLKLKWLELLLSRLRFKLTSTLYPH